jgi:hypothetical protein
LWNGRRSAEVVEVDSEGTVLVRVLPKSVEDVLRA